MRAFNRHILRIGYRAFDRLRRLYWRVTKPTRFGIKVLVIHPDKPDHILLIRQAYGNTRRYALPGGGYRPAKENVDQAARREIGEEVGLRLSPEMRELCKVESTMEGKTDNITILVATAIAAAIKPGAEVLEAVWADVNTLSPANYPSMSQFVTTAVSKYASPM